MQERTRGDDVPPGTASIRSRVTLGADARHDAAHGLRVLLRTPGFTAIALLVFALGIGATTAIVSVADALLMRPLPVPDVDRVMTVWQQHRETGAGRADVAPGNAISWITRARSFEAAAIAESWTVNAVSPGREPETLPAAFVSAQFFTVIGAPMLQGRAFLPQEHEPNAGRVAILSHRLWRDRFDSHPALVGQAVTLDEGGAYTIVGVLPPGLDLRLFERRFTQRDPDVWLPKQGFSQIEPTLRGQGYWNVLGRLRPGVTIDAARADLDALSAQLATEFPQTNRQIVAQVVPLRTHLVGSLGPVLPLLVGFAAILLTVACANVANLLLARGVGRAREFAVRQALGAGRGRLIRQMLVESLLLAIAGGVAGLGLARAMLHVIAALRPVDVAGLDAVPIDARAAAIACGVTIVAALVAGLTPALQLSRPAAVRALREGRTSARRGVRGLLVVLEVAAALVLAVGAGLLVRSFLLIQQVDTGFRRDEVAVLQLFTSPRLDSAQKRVAFFQEALDRLAALPGVVAAGGVSAVPFGAAKVAIRGPIAIRGRAAAPGEDNQAWLTAVAGDYFHAMSVPLLQGRLFDATDTASSRQVALVSRSAARKFWPGADPVGARVTFRFTGTAYDAEVVGVVGEVRHELDRGAPPEIFLPHAQSGFRALSLVVRTAPGSPATLQVLKEQIWALDARQPIAHAARLDDLVARTLVNRRFSLVLLGSFALATLLLAAIGVYGVVSFTTSQRTREFGVRMALGAARHDIVALVLRDGLTLAIAGVLAGLAISLPLMPLMRALLFGVSATDPITFGAVSLALLLAAAAACYLPARRALAGDPVASLRLD